MTVTPILRHRRWRRDQLSRTVRQALVRPGIPMQVSVRGSTIHVRLNVQDVLAASGSPVRPLRIVTHDGKATRLRGDHERQPLRWW